MTTEEQIRNVLDEVVEIDLLTKELMKSAFGKEIVRLMTKREKMINCASRLMEEYDGNMCQSTDGTVVAWKKNTYPSIPFQNIKDTGLAQMIVDKYPEYLSVSSTIRKTEVGDISAFANGKPQEVTAIMTDDDYKFVRTKILQEAEIGRGNRTPSSD